jgi:hypothetical protein
VVAWQTILASEKSIPVAGTLLRLVESQEQVATSQLVSTLDRQVALEDMLEATKPPYRQLSEGLHYLLATPFRYPPLNHGSRFGSRFEPSLFYGSQETRTVLAEAAFYRFYFWSGMAQAPQGKLDTQHTLFEAAYKTTQGFKLQSQPFVTYSAELSHPAEYKSSQALGTLMRASGIQVFEYISARDKAQGINVALFTPLALSNKKPLSQEPWLCELTASHVKFHAVRGKGIHEFPLEDFLVEEKLPQPA